MTNMFKTQVRYVFTQDFASSNSFYSSDKTVRILVFAIQLDSLAFFHFIATVVVRNGDANILQHATKYLSTYVLLVINSYLDAIDNASFLASYIGPKCSLKLQYAYSMPCDDLHCSMCLLKKLHHNHNINCTLFPYWHVYVIVYTYATLINNSE